MPNACVMALNNFTFPLSFSMAFTALCFIFDYLFKKQIQSFTCGTQNAKLCYTFKDINSLNKAHLGTSLNKKLSFKYPNNFDHSKMGGMKRQSKFVDHKPNAQYP